MKKRFYLLLLLVLFVTISLTGCGNTEATVERHLESGVIDTEYEGIPNPELVVKMKLTPEEEKGNFEKITPVTRSTQAELEAEVEEFIEEETKSDAPRPKI